MDLVYSNLFAQLIELAKQSGEQTDDFLRLRILRELSEADHICVQECHILKAVHYSLVILDTCENVQWH